VSPFIENLIRQDRKLNANIVNLMPERPNERDVSEPIAYSTGIGDVLLVDEHACVESPMTLFQ